MMKNNSKETAHSQTIIGTGLVALDVVITDVTDTAVQFYAGGSCGNVLAISAYLGWQSYPIARLSNNPASQLLSQDLQFWTVKQDLITYSDSGSTPIIIHRILRDKKGIAKHRFEFRNPEDGKYLPSYKPFLAKDVNLILENNINPEVFYFDRINRAAIELAKEYKKRNAIVIFEPSSIKDEKGFHECLSVVDIIKFAHDRLPNYSDLFPEALIPLEIQTMGERGLQFRRRGEKRWNEVLGVTVENVLDTAGAGDWCTAGFITQLFKTRKPFEITELSSTTLSKALMFGQALSALNCRYEGARGLMYAVNRNDLLSMVEEILHSKDKRISSNFVQPTKRPQFLRESISSLVE